MTIFEWVQISQFVVMSVITLLVYWFGRERTTLISKAEAEKAFALMAQRIEDHEKRLERAGQRQSDLTDDVQNVIGRLERMPEQLRGVFLDVARGDDLKEEQRLLRERLDREVKQRRS